MENKNTETNQLLENQTSANSPQSESSQVVDYDYVVSEAAVGQVDGVVFTLSGIYPKSDDANPVYMVTIDINKSDLVEVHEGSIIQLNEKTSLKVLRIDAPSEASKGKVYFKKM